MAELKLWMRSVNYGRDARPTHLHFVQPLRLGYTKINFHASLALLGFVLPPTSYCLLPTALVCYIISFFLIP
jgi:hypothetical protein